MMKCPFAHLTCQLQYDLPLLPPVRTCGNLQINRAKLIFTDESRQTGSSVVVKCDNCTRAFGFQQSYCKANGQRMAWTPSLNQTRCQGNEAYSSSVFFFPHCFIFTS